MIISLLPEGKYRRHTTVDIWSDRKSVDGDYLLLEKEDYLEINAWCIENLGYHTRTAYNRYRFFREKDYTLFLLRWA